MTNVLVHVEFVVDVSATKVQALVGRPDDQSEAYWVEATDRAKDWVRDNLSDALEMAGEPELDA